MSRDAPLTLGEAARSAHQALSAAGIDDPGRNGRLLVAAATGCSTGDIIAHPERQLSGGASGRLAELIERRSAHEPLSRILGEREFYGRRFALSAATLDPRPDSETLIAVALAIADREGWRDRPVRILDIGTGTGCLLLTLLAELPLASGVGTDISHEALATAAENAAALGLAERATFAAHDVLDGVEGRYDLVVSNPPYIPSGDIAGLDREVQDFDPRAALDGGVDGLDIYRRIAAGLEGVQPRWVILEVGAAQADDVACVLQKAFVKTRQAELTLHLDLGGHARCVALGLQS
ncbi:MAG: peptide chain release factor N(5)-glutamine methyltransferase [Hyphomicrobium sp.]|jgi:release factor glutamine methyltransferase